MYKLGLAHEAKPERVAAPSIPIEESGPQDGTEVGSKAAAGACSQQNSPKHQDGTPASPHPSAPVVPGTGEATGEEATTAAPTRPLIHNIIDYPQYLVDDIVVQGSEPEMGVVLLHPLHHNGLGCGHDWGVPLLPRGCNDNPR